MTGLGTWGIRMKLQLTRVASGFSAAVLSCWSLTSISVQAQDGLGSVDGNSQGLTLFEEVETAVRGNNSPSRPSREARVTMAEPEFTLVGTSRIGSEYTALVKHKNGEVLSIEAKPNENTVIEGHIDFSVVDIAAGTISIRYPSNNPCIEFSDRGVRCNAAGNIAELILANGEPLLSANSATISQNENGSGLEEDSEELNTDPANPFEALRNAQNVRAANGQNGNPASGRFTPRRINPEDVPEGMRVIATPFGDRLVEQ